MAMARGHSAAPMIKCRDPDVVDLDRLIMSRIWHGVEDAYRKASPDKLLRAARDFSGHGVCWHEPVDGSWSGHVMLPGDFLRLAVFAMSDWALPVFDAIDCRSPRYRLTASRYAALRGSPRRPVAVVADMPEGRALEFFSCSSPDQWIAQAAYCPLPVVDEYGGIDIADSMIDDVIHSIAERVNSEQ